MGHIHEEDEAEIDLKELFFVLKKKIWLIITVGLIAGCLAAGWSKFLVTPMYSSTSSILVLSKETTLTSLADLQLGSQLANDYKVLITSRPVLEDVIANLDLSMGYKELRAAVTVQNPADTRILEVSVANPDPILACEIVDELAEVSSAFIGDKMEVTPPKIIETGEVALYPDSPSVKRNAMMGLLAGAVLTAGVIAVLNMMNDTIRTEEDIARYLELSTFAVVPDKAQEKKARGKNSRTGKGKR